MESFTTTTTTTLVRYTLLYSSNKYGTYKVALFNFIPLWSVHSFIQHYYSSLYILNSTNLPVFSARFPTPFHHPHVKALPNKQLFCLQRRSVAPTFPPGMFGLVVSQEPLLSTMNQTHRSTPGHWLFSLIRLAFYSLFVIGTNL